MGYTRGPVNAIAIQDGVIVNADVSDSAAIILSKLSGTANTVVQAGTGGVLESSAVTKTELSYVGGATSNIQAQINTKAPTASPTFSGTITTPLTANTVVIATTGGALSNAASLTASRVLVADANGIPAVSTLTTTQANALTGSTVWTAYTPTGAWSANTTYTGFYKIVGDTMYVQAKIQLAGAPDAAQCTFLVPTGYVIDTSKLLITANTQAALYGGGLIWDASSANYQIVPYYSNSTTAISIFRYAIAAAPGTSQPGAVNATTPITFASGDSVVICAAFPVTTA